MASIICALCCDRKTQKRAMKGSSRSPSREASVRMATDSSTRSFADGLTDAFSSASFVPKSFTPGSFGRDDVQDAGENRKRLKELKALVKRLEGPVQKFPKSGKGILKKMQDRYIAVQPGEETHPSQHKDTSLSEIDCLKNGQLAYWENATAHKQGNPPKGDVVLLKIAKVWVSKDDSKGKSVVVKHKVGYEMQEMVLCFPTKRDADEWSYALWEFISKLRGQENAVPAS